MPRFLGQFLLIFVATLVAGPSPATAATVGWSAPTSVDPTGQLSAVSCVSASFCVAVDNRFAAAGYALAYDGHSWSAPLLIDSTGGFNDVSCPTTSFCAAVTSDGRAYTYDGSSWSAPTSLGTGETLNAVSCTSSAFCLATGSANSSGDVFIYNGTGWSRPPQPNPANVIDDVSCPTSSFCVAADDAGNVLTFDGGSWSAPDAIGDVNSLSCPTTSFCMAITDGAAISFDDGVWSPPTPFALAGGLLRDVSCSSSSFCAAVTSADQALLFDGSGWSGPTRIVAAGDGSTQLSSVSCSGPFCATVDRAGNALVYPVSVTPAASQPIKKPRAASGEPLAPSDFRAVKVTARSITLSWRAPQHGSRPAGYVIAELAPSHPGYARVARLRPNAREYTVRRLRPRTRYRFRIESIGVGARAGRATAVVTATRAPWRARTPRRSALRARAARRGA